MSFHLFLIFFLYFNLFSFFSPFLLSYFFCHFFTFFFSSPSINSVLQLITNHFQFIFLMILICHCSSHYTVFSPLSHLVIMQALRQDFGVSLTSLQKHCVRFSEVPSHPFWITRTLRWRGVKKSLTCSSPISRCPKLGCNTSAEFHWFQLVAKFITELWKGYSCILLQDGFFIQWNVFNSFVFMVPNLWKWVELITG